MHRAINWALMLATLASAVALYVIKNDTRRLEARVLAQERVLERAKTDVTVLTAERAHLSRPARLEPLALKSGPELKVALAEPLAGSWARPDIVDRAGRLLATDIAVNSLYADPHLILDLDEAIEKLSATLPGLDVADLRKSLADGS